MTHNGSQFTAVADSFKNGPGLLKAFELASKKDYVHRSYAKMIGQSAISQMRMPWSLTKLMVLSLEKVNSH